MLFVKFETKIPFTWWVLIGSGVTFGVGWAVSVIDRNFAAKSAGVKTASGASMKERDD
jgi:hypothetical protein